MSDNALTDTPPETWFATNVSLTRYRRQFESIHINPLRGGGARLAIDRDGERIFQTKLSAANVEDLLGLLTKALDAKPTGEDAS